MIKKSLLVLLMAVQITGIFAGSVQNKQAAMLEKQKEEFIKGVRGIRNLFSKDTVTDEEKAALKSLAKKGSLLIAALTGIYLGRKYYRRKFGTKRLRRRVNSDSPVLFVCDEAFSIKLPQRGEKTIIKTTDAACDSFVSIEQQEIDAQGRSVFRVITNPGLSDKDYYTIALVVAQAAGLEQYQKYYISVGYNDDQGEFQEKEVVYSR